MTDFEKEIAAGFSELAEVAGNARFTLNGSAPFRGLIYGPTPAQSRLDLAMGRSYMVRIEVSRLVLPTPRPKVGDTLIEARGGKFDIAEVAQHDQTDPTVIYVCRTTAGNS